MPNSGTQTVAGAAPDEDGVRFFQSKAKLFCKVDVWFLFADTLNVTALVNIVIKVHRVA